MADIDKLGRGEAIELARKMRNKVRNIAVDKDKLTKRITTTAVAAGAAYGVAYWMGQAEADYLANKGAIDAGSAEDPRKIAGMDKDLLIGLALTGVGLLGGSAKGGGKVGQGAGDVAEAAGVGILSGYAYMKGLTHGVEAAQQG